MASINNFVDFDHRISDKTREIILKSAGVLNNLDCDSIKERGLKELDERLKDCVRKDLENKHLLDKVNLIYENIQTAANIDDLPDLEACYEKFQNDLETIHSVDFHKEIRRDKDVCIMKDILAQNSLEVNAREEVPKEEDLDIVTTQEKINLVDPITKCQIEDPVRHKPCGHVYDRKSLESMINTRKRKGFKCAYMGCSYRNPILMENMIPALDYIQEINRLKQQHGL